MIRLVLSAVGLTLVTVIVHGVGTGAITGRVVRLGAKTKGRGRLATELLMAQLVSLLLLLHLAEAAVWGLFYLLVGGLPDFKSAVYFSLTSYTTVGYGDMTLPQPWRLLGPLEAAVGVLMLGWSTGILVAAIGRLSRDLFPPLEV